MPQQPPAQLFEEPAAEPRHPSISTNTLTLTLGTVPSQLARKRLSDSAWTAWLQAALGAQVRVRSLRTLDSTSMAVPSKGTQVVIGLEPTSETIIRDVCAQAARTTGPARAALRLRPSAVAAPER